MDKYIVRLSQPVATKRKSTDVRDNSKEPVSDPELEEPPDKIRTLNSDDSVSDQSSTISSHSSSSSSKMWSYKHNLSYDPRWKTKYPWMEFCSGGMVCTVCRVHGKIPVQAKGAWVTRPVSNWVKATYLLAKHDKHSPSAIYVHCRCHQLQLAALNAANEHTEVKRVLGTLLTIWKAFHYSPKKGGETGRDTIRT